LELRFDFRSVPPIGVAPLRVMPATIPTALGDAPVENDLYCRVRGEPLAKILKKIRVSARDDKQVASHLLLGLDAGELLVFIRFRDTPTLAHEAYRVPVVKTY
jgi:hypothetical protein